MITSSKSNSKSLSEKRKDEERQIFKFPSSSYVPLNSKEVPIFNELMHYRHQLSEFHKKNKHMATLLDISRFASDLGTIMEHLRQVRNDELLALSKTKTIEQYNAVKRNKIDDLLDYVWGLLFKEWVQIAGVGEPSYAFYAKLATIMRQLDLFKTSQAYTIEDIVPLQKRLEFIEKEIEQSSLLISNEEKEKTEDLSDKNEVKQKETIIAMTLVSGEAMLSSLLRRIHRNIKYMISFASSVPAELVEIHDELNMSKKELQMMDGTNEYPEENLDNIIQRLGDIDALRVHEGRFLPIPIAQASTLGLLFECYDMSVSLKIRKLNVDHTLSELYQELICFEAQLLSVFRFERFNVSVVNMREYEKRLYEIKHARFKSDEFLLSTAESKLILHYHLAKCHHLVRMLLLGVEDISESLLSIYEKLSILYFKSRDGFLKAMRHEAGHDHLYFVRSELVLIEDSKKDNLYYGDIVDFDSKDVPRGQTILQSFVEELYEESEVLESWLTIF